MVGDAVRPCWDRPLDTVFIDPARRSGTGRTFDPRSHQPSLATAIDRIGDDPTVIIGTEAGLSSRDRPSAIEDADR